MMQEWPGTPVSAPSAPQAQGGWPGTPVQQAAPARPAAPRPAPARPQAAPAPQTIGDSGLTREQIFAAQRAQGYDDADIDANIAEMFGGDPGMAQRGYGVLNSEDISPQEAERLIASGEYQRDPVTGNVFRYVAPPAPVAPAAPAQPAAPTGYDLAVADEQRKTALLGDQAGATFTDQFTAPINDELGWAAGYAGQSVENLIRRLRGEEVEIGAIDRARAIRQLTKDDQAQYEREKPLESLGGAVVGGAAFGPSRAMAIPGLLGRLGQAGGVSALYGAADGEGALDRGGKALLAGGIGVLTAGTMEGLGAGASGLMRSHARSRAPAGSLPTRPEQRVGRAIETAIRNDEMAPADAIANMQTGRHPFAAAGENLVGLAEVAAQAPGRARTDLVRAATAIQDGAGDRVTRQLSDQFGAEGDFYVTLRNRVREQRRVANDGMAQIANSIVALDAPAVAALRSNLSSPAIRNAAEEAIAELTPQGSAAANRLFGLSDRLADMPAGANITVREAQDISYALKEAAGRAYRGGFNARGEALQNLSTAIRGNARSPERGGVQAYDEWLTRFGDDAEANDALRVGKNLFVRPNERNATSVPELRERWADWSDLSKENFRLGVGEAILDQVRNSGGVPALRRVLKNQDVSERIGLAFGDEAELARFMQFATDETTLQAQLNQIFAGSQTARRVAGRADLEAQGFDPLDFVEAGADLLNPVGASRQALRLAAKNLPRRDRSILGDEELNGLLGSALTNEADMTRLLNLMQSEAGLRSRVTEQARRWGLLSVPGAHGAGQDRARGLLTANP